MPVPSYQLTCTRNTVIARDVYEFAFTRPKEMTYKAGQFVLFDVAHPENPQDIQTRAFSIASSPEEDELLFVAKMKEGGRASVWIKDRLQVGSTVRTQGPFGRFILDRETTKDYFFIATSTGVAPFRGQLREALLAGDKRRMDLVFGVRSEQDLFWAHECQNLARQHANFFLHIALSQPTKHWAGHRGRVQTLAPLIAKEFANKNVYMCGSPEMTKELKQVALEEWNIDKKDLHVEGYI